ncbi:CBS domain-containing protein [Sphingomonas naphthae]|uniref:CBS domain-containing protein n=1 Tax=Sphingomonas naphthae TaxID=1813468 RepID=A0ABY7TL76_9SPHN|nr:CBS domain-containing protein [Sphingomonas naphthae]WCT73135.1 CBS domain-containing protein [Sphingomonas naphthae]
MTIAAILEARDAHIISVNPEATVREVVALLAAQRIGAVPVVEDGRVIGILSERDIIRGLAGEGPALLDRAAGEVMTSPVISVEPGLEPLEGLTLMTRQRVRHLPVMAGEAMIGFVSIGDLVKARIEAIEREAEAMRVYIQTA